MDTKKTLRSFGLIVGGIFLLIALSALVVGKPVRAWALYPALPLLGLAMVAPGALHWPFRGWMFLGGVLGWVNTRIILGFTFYLIVTPIGALMRVIRGDLLNCRFLKGASSYQVKRAPRLSNHYERMF